MSGYRPAYTNEEEKKIVDYIIENREYHRLKGDKLWKVMEKNLMIDRTWHSLKQHFRKKIIDRLHYPHYQLSIEEQNKIRTFYHGSGNRNAQPGSEDQDPLQLGPENRATGQTETRQVKQPKTTVDVETGRRVPNFLASSSSSSDSD